MKIYKVGGSIRDKLLGLKVEDNDFVVVGSSCEEMLKLGFIQVGKDFPVFLHPVSGEEYALARGEKKVSRGHRGFEISANPQISLTEDLSRRDITINAIAEDEHGNLFDPFNGLTDLKNHIIRHVSPAFIEDPLRVLRAARFSAKLNFKVAASTIELMRKIVDDKELLTLSKERIWDEVNKAVMLDNSIVFFKVLDEVGALAQILPEFSSLFRDEKLLKQFENMCKMAEYQLINAEQRLALIYYLSSLKHNLKDSKNFIQNAYLTKTCKELAYLLCTNYPKLDQLNTLNDIEIYTIIRHLDPIRRHNRYAIINKLFSILSIALQNDKINIKLNLLNEIIKQFGEIDHSKLLVEGDDIKAVIDQEKLKIINKVVSTFNAYS